MSIVPISSSVRRRCVCALGAALVVVAASCTPDTGGTTPEPTVPPTVDCTARGPRANLQGCDLSDENLSEQDLSDANLRGTNLSNANLAGTDLDGADLAKANLYTADLSGAVANGATFDDANLEVANLTTATLSGASLKRASLFQATALGTQFVGRRPHRRRPHRRRGDRRRLHRRRVRIHDVSGRLRGEQPRRLPRGLTCCPAARGPRPGAGWSVAEGLGRPPVTPLRPGTRILRPHAVRVHRDPVAIR